MHLFLTNFFHIITNEMLIKKKHYCFIIRIDNRILNPIRSNLFFLKKIV